MRRVLLAAALVIISLPSFADCESDIDDLKAKIDDKKADYSVKARAEARKHLAKAERNKDNPKECRTEIANALKALQGGKK